MSVTPTKIVQHLKTYLPLFTDAFTDLLTVSAATISAGNVLTVTSTGHGKSAGQYVVLSGGFTRNILTAAVLSGDNVQFTTTYDHDLTNPQLPDDPQTLVLSGFGNVWDAIHDIAGVPNRQNFLAPLPTGETLAPTIDGNQYLIDSLPLGAYPIATVPDADTLTVSLSNSPVLPLGTVDNLEIISGFRIAAAADYDRARAAYSEQGENELYLFVIMVDTDVSKDRHTLNDGVAGVTVQDERLIRLLHNFSTTVFIPTTGDLSGADAQDMAYGDLFTALLQALFGSAIDKSIINYLTVPAGHGPGEYNSAFYVHVYDWQLPVVINYSDGFLIQPETAFRDISQTLKLFADEEAQMTLDIDLDEEPL